MTHTHAQFRPWYAPAARPNAIDIVIMVDTSGSMSAAVQSGSRLQLAQQTVSIALATLNPRDRVAVVSFNSVMDTAGVCESSLRPSSCPLTLPIPLFPPPPPSSPPSCSGLLLD